MILFLKLSKLILVNVELNCVVTSCDGLHIEVNELVGLNCFQIVKVDYDVEVDEDAEGTSHQPEDLPLARP